METQYSARRIPGAQPVLVLDSFLYYKRSEFKSRITSLLAPVGEVTERHRD